MKSYFLLALIAFSMMAFSCNSQPAASLPPKEFAAGTGNENALLLDVRTPEEYNEGHLKGAILINYHDSDFVDQVSKLDKNKTVYVYCHSGKRSSAAQEKMQKMNFKNVINLDGGIVAWQKAGLPVE